MLIFFLSNYYLVRGLKVKFIIKSFNCRGRFRGFKNFGFRCVWLRYLMVVCKFCEGVMANSSIIFI